MHHTHEPSSIAESLSPQSGNGLEVVRVLPDQADDSQLPVYFAGGVGYGPGSGKTEPVLQAIAMHGREAWATMGDQTRGVDERFAITAESQTKVGNRADAWRALGEQATSRVVALHQETAAENLLAAMDNAGIRRTDAIFQSADALNGLIAATEQPERFNNIILAYPGGQVRRPRPLQNIKSTLRESIQDRLSGSTLRTVPSTVPTTSERRGDRHARFARYAGQSAMGLAATHSFQGDMLTELRQQENRPGVAPIVGLRDWMIRYDEVLGSLGSADNVDYVMVVDSGHGIKGRQDILEQMLELFPMLEASKKVANHTDRPLRDRLILPEHISKKRAEEIRALADKVAI